jgi:hypothetical protein
VEQVGEHLVPGRSALVAEIDEDWVTPLDHRMEAVGGTVFRRTKTQIEDAHFEREIEAQQAELASLEAERLAQLEGGREMELAEHKARLQEKIDAVQRRVKERQDALAARIRSVKEEGDEKIAALQAQAAEADQASKARIEKRMAEVRSAYRHRAVSLSDALERRKAARETVV